MHEKKNGERLFSKLFRIQNEQKKKWFSDWKRGTNQVVEQRVFTELDLCFLCSAELKGESIENNSHFFKREEKLQ